MAEKRKFLLVKIPLLNLEKEILGTNTESLNNKRIRIDLTRTLRGKSMEVIFQINADKEKALAEPRKLNLAGFFIRRVIRKGTDYVEDSFYTDCKDKMLRIKPFLIARKKVSRRVRKALRESAKEYIKNYVKNKGVGEVFGDIISSKLQKSLSLKMKKIYPLSLCEIRVLEVKEDKKPEGKEEDAEKSAREESKNEEEEAEKPVEKTDKTAEEIKEKKEEKKQEDKTEKEKPEKEKPKKTKKRESGVKKKPKDIIKKNGKRIDSLDINTKYLKTKTYSKR